VDIITIMTRIAQFALKKICRDTTGTKLHCTWLLFVSEVGVIFVSSVLKHTHPPGIVDVLFFFNNFSDFLFHIRVRYDHICPWFCMGPTRGCTYKKK
jgi:hypothetical protein